MSKERLRNIGVSFAVTSLAALTSCSNEAQHVQVPEQDFTVTVIEPGRCREIVDDNISVCNTFVDRYSNRVGIIRRMENGVWQDKDGIDIFRNEKRKVDGQFEGISIFRDDYNNLHVKVEEPLLSATPFPTQTPEPKIPDFEQPHSDRNNA